MLKFVKIAALAATITLTGCASMSCNTAEECAARQARAAAAMQHFANSYSQQQSQQAQMYQQQANQIMSQPAYRKPITCETTRTNNNQATTICR